MLRSFLVLLITLLLYSGWGIIDPALATAERPFPPRNTEIDATRGQLKSNDLFKGLRRGQRVIIVLNNNISYSGIIKSIIDNKIEIDVSYDDPILKGSFSFRTRNIKSIISLTSLNLEERKKMILAKESLTDTAKEKHSSMTTKPLDEEQEATDNAKTTSSDDESQKRLAQELLSKFPPGETWNQKTYQTILDKNEFLRTPEEKDFLKNYNQWLKATELKEKEDRFSFFQRYLPENGWGEEKYTDLITKFIRLKIGLTSEEQEFVDKFELWKKTRIEYEEEKKKSIPQDDEQKSP
ncbi:MAG: hypothetical protein QME51_01450 [Planctomycetota bacterium]|nr:hypothetical protein [Planctomycetota bacterium]MDI6787020.1 hypothetical protein [Planctomycetota bacterium]